MTSSLDVIFRELGLSQYLDHFVDQGFDTWDTILDIQESDLDALKVKLGHRRKLQRRIANSRGLAPQVSLASPTRQSIEDGRLDANRSDPSLKSDGRDGHSAKRKYRRHPKPDENAPERPPSAYVLFSNKMRDDLKGRQLTFTEIAKLVGENWQSLSPTEREPFETKAQEDKERYNRELADYKKTDHYERYGEYLNEFKKRQALQSQEKDAAKRLKAENSESNRASAGSGSPGSPQNCNRSPNSEDSQMNDTALNCQHHFVPATSDFMPNINATRQLDHREESGIADAVPLTSDNLARNRHRGLSSPHSHEMSLPHGTRAGWGSSLRTPVEAPGAKLPWLQGTEHRAAFGSISSLGDSKPLPSLSSTPNHGSRSSISSGFTSASRPPSLKTEPSSTGSMSSASYSLPRTPSDASLSIHALLSCKPEPTYLSQQMPPMHSSPQSSMLGYNSASASQDVLMHGMHTMQPSGPTIPPISKMPITQEPLIFSGISGRLPEPNIHSSREGGLDGISALLRARDIVERRPA